MNITALTKCSSNMLKTFLLLLLLPTIIAFVLRQFFIAPFSRSVCTVALYIVFLRKTLVSLTCCEIIVAHHFRGENCIMAIQSAMQGIIFMEERGTFGTNP